MRTLFLIVILILTLMNTYAQHDATTFIEYQDVYSVYITKDLVASKDFYVKWLDFDVLFEASWCVYLQSKGHQKFTFAFINETHPSSPPTYGSFNGQGSFLTLQVQDVSSVYKRLSEKHAPITYHLKKEDWGQIRFGLTDPNGLYIDIVQQVEPVTGYWDNYMVSEK